MAAALDNVLRESDTFLVKTLAFFIYIFSVCAAAPAPRTPAQGGESEGEFLDSFQGPTQPVATSDDKMVSHLNLVAWRLKKNVKPDVDRMASVLAASDVAVFHGIEFNERGETAISVIASVLERRLGEKVCRGWFKTLKGERGRNGFLWREQKLGFVDSQGELRESCSSRPVVWRARTLPLSLATFYFKSNRKLIHLIAAAPEKARAADADLKALVQKFDETGWPVVVTGETRALTSKPLLTSARLSFKPARETWGARKPSALAPPEGFYYKNLSVVEANIIDLRNQSGGSQNQLRDGALGERWPTQAIIAFNEQEADTLQSQLISKKKATSAAAGAGSIVLKGPSYPAPVNAKELSIKEDLESEALADDPTAAKAKRGRKKKK